MSLKNTKAFLCCLLCLIVCFVAVGCIPDLGEIDDAEDYQKKFSSVVFVKQDLSKQSLSINDLYNDDAVDFNKADFHCPTQESEYKYFAVFAGEDVSVEEFVLYLYSQEDVVVTMYVYKANDVPSVIATGNLDSDSETYTNPDTGEENTRIKTFDEPDKTTAVAQITVSLKAGQWKSFGVKSWTIDGEKKSVVSLEKDSCLLFQIANNRVVYNQDGQPAKELNSAKLRFTAMLIRVK